MISYTHINTEQAQRIAKRLCNHWKHKFEVIETAHSTQIMLPDAVVSLSPQAAQLNVSIDATAADHRTLQHVVIDHLNRMAQQEFEVVWQSCSSKK